MSSAVFDIRRRGVLFLIGMAIFLPFCFIEVNGLPGPARSAGVALLMAFFWVTEALPLAVTSLIPLILHPVLGIANANDTAKSYFNDIQVF